MTQSRLQVAVILLEIGVAIHSVIIGIDLGIHPGGKSLQPLLVALCFHQLFEGLAVGTALVHAKIAKRWVLMASGKCDHVYRLIPRLCRLKPR